LPGKFWASVNPEGAPDSVLQFIDRHIESVEHLEILLLLSGDSKDWRAAEIYSKIQSSQASIEQRLQQLSAAGLLVQNGAGYHFEPRNDATRQVVRELADLYRQRRVRVIEAIYSRKTDSVQSFADAFKLRRKD
jgi:predicted transcriptional regulator